MKIRTGVAVVISSVCLYSALALEGRVVDPKGAPVADAVVAALLPTDKVPKEGANFVETKSDRGGAFVLDTRGATPLLLVWKEGFAPARLKSPDGGTPLSIALTPGFTLDGAVLATKTGKPIVGATVVARGASSQFIDPKQADRFASKATSVTSGRFTLNNLGDDFYDLHAWAPGFARASRPGIAVSGRAAVPAVNLSLSEGTSLSGDVRGSDGKPLANATVIVAPRPRSLRGAMGAATSSDQVKTDSKGAFSIEHIPAVERYSVTISHPDQTTLLLAEVKPSAAGRLGPLSLKMPAGARLVAALTTPDGTPYSGKISVTLTPKQSERSVFDRTQQPQKKEIDIAGGVLSLDRLMAGSFSAALNADGYAPWKHDGLVLEGGETVDLGEIALQTGLGLGGTVVDAQSHPVGAATVRAIVRSRGSQPMATATSDSEGRFRLAGLPPEGELRLYASRTGVGNGSLTLDSRPADAVTLTLVPPVTVRGRVLIGDPPQPLSVYTVSLILNTPDEDSPLPPMLRGENVRARSATRDAAGQFSLQADKPGTYAVKIEADGFVPARVEGLAADAGGNIDAGDIVLSPGATLQVRVVEKGSGVAIAGASVGIQQPGLLGMMASMDPSAQAGDLVTGTDGTTQLRSLPPGNQIVRVAHDSYAKTTATATIEPNQRVASLVIEVGPGGTLEGTVRNEQGLPLTGAMVMPQQGMMPDPAKSATTDDQGRYRIEHLPAGAYMVMVIPMDNLDESSPQAAQSSVMGRMKMQSTEISDNKTVTLNFPAAQIITVSGVVKRGNKPVSATLMWLKQSAGSMATANTDDAGSYKVEITSPGTYMVMVVPKGENAAEVMANASLTVEVPDGQAVFTKDLVLSEERFTGSVRDGGTGAGLDQARLMALPIDAGGAYDDKRQGLMRQAATDKQGRFEMEALTAGRWRVTVSRQGYGTVTLPEMSIEDGDTPPEADIALFPARARGLRVIDEGGAPVTGAMAFGLTSFSGAEMMVTSGQDGMLQMNTLADGSHDLIVVAAGHAPHVVKGFTVDEESVGNVETVVLTKGETVVVKVLDEAREPVKGATVSRLIAAGLGDFGIAYGMISMTTARMPTSGGDGIVTLIPLEPGRYELAVTAGTKRGNAKFEVKGGTRAEVSVTVR